MARQGLTVQDASPPVRSTATPRIVSDVHGPLRRLLLCFPREAAVRRGYRAAYADLFAKLPAETRLTVIAHPQARGDLTQLLESAGRRATTTIVRTDRNLRFTVWAQDPCVVLRAEGETVLLTPADFERQQDAESVALLARAIGARVQRSSLFFHGGDILAGDDFVLVGRTCSDTAPPMDGSRGSATRTAARAGAAPTEGPELASHVRALLDPDRRVHLVGTGRSFPQNRTRTRRVKDRDRVEILPGGAASPHPLIHLDMFLTLAGRGPDGRYRVLVGSPALADDLLERAPVDDALDDHLDDVGAQLAVHGFEVLRNPLPLTYGNGRREVDGAVRDVRLWYLASANNCLVQIDPRMGDHVWLPTYGHGAWRELGITDAANRLLWERLGFTVHELASFHTFTQRFGALHCITKALDRRPGPLTAGQPGPSVARSSS